MILKKEIADAKFLLSKHLFPDKIKQVEENFFKTLYSTESYFKPPTHCLTLSFIRNRPSNPSQLVRHFGVLANERKSTQTIKL